MLRAGCFVTGPGFIRAANAFQSPGLQPLLSIIGRESRVLSFFQQAVHVPNRGFHFSKYEQASGRDEPMWGLFAASSGRISGRATIYPCCFVPQKNKLQT
jgi:hypothetical protein